MLAGLTLSIHFDKTPPRDSAAPEQTVCGWIAQPNFCAFWIVWTLNFDAHGNLGLLYRSCSLEKFDSYYFQNGCRFDSFSNAKNSISWKFEIYAKIASFLLWHLQRVNLIWNHQLGKNNCLLEVCNKHKNCLVLMIVTCLSQLIKNQVFWAFQLIFTTLARVRVKKKWLKKGQKCTFQISWNITFWKSTKILQWLWFLPIFWNLTERRFKSFGQYLEKWGGNNLPKDW